MIVLARWWNVGFFCQWIALSFRQSLRSVVSSPVSELVIYTVHELDIRCFSHSILNEEQLIGLFTCVYPLFLAGIGNLHNRSHNCATCGIIGPIVATVLRNHNRGPHSYNNYLRRSSDVDQSDHGVVWRTPLECQCTPGRTPFKSCPNNITMNLS
jgi:hypothetical protein